MKADLLGISSVSRLYSRLSSADKIVIGLSGGADSVALTHILFSIFGADRLICAHVNHGIRGEEAERDASFAQNYAESLGIRFVLRSCDVPAMAKEKHLGCEEAGRIVRYGFFEELADTETSLICTAHNADDNAETVLLNLTRGTGLKGLSGIPLVRGKVVRPVLSMTRADIEQYCSKNNLSYVTDSTNLTDEYNRNKIRHAVIPELKLINPAAVRNILRMSDLCSSEDCYLDSKAGEVLDSSKNRWGFSAESLSKADDVILSRALKLMTKTDGLEDPSALHIEGMINVVRNGGSIDIPGNRRFFNSQGTVLILDRNQHSFEDEVSSPGQEHIRDGRRLCISEIIPKNSIKIHNLRFINFADYDKIKNSLAISSRREGDKFTIHGKITKKLKKMMTEMKIPEPLRDTLFVVRDGDVPVFTEGIGVDFHYGVDSETERVIKFTVKA